MSMWTCMHIRLHVQVPVCTRTVAWACTCCLGMPMQCMDVHVDAKGGGGWRERVVDHNTRNMLNPRISSQCP